MHGDYEKAHRLSSVTIGAAIEVHREKGAGLIESIYEKCLKRELELRGVCAETQVEVQVEYKGLVFDECLRLDLIVENCVIVELKAVQDVLPVHKAQLLSYMKLLDIPVGLLFNFHEVLLKDGLHRMLLPGADGR